MDRHDDVDASAADIAQLHELDLAGAHASEGAIFVSNAVRELCVGKEFSFDSSGPFDLKGFAEPVPLFEVAWR